MSGGVEPSGAGAAGAAPAPDVGKTAKSIREWVSFVLGVGAALAGVIIWFYTQIGAIEDSFEEKLKGYVSKEIHGAQVERINEKLTGLTVSSVTKADLALVKQQVDSLQQRFESYVKQEGESWAAVKKSSKEIRELVTQIQLTLARLTR